MAKIGILHATGSGILMAWIVPDKDADLGTAHKAGPNQTLMIVDAADVQGKTPEQTSDNIKALIAKQTGKPVPSGRCAVINDKGKVEAVIIADPIISASAAAFSTKELVLSDEAAVGWTKQADGSLKGPEPVVDVTPFDAGPALGEVKP